MIWGSSRLIIEIRHFRIRTRLSRHSRTMHHSSTPISCSWATDAITMPSERCSVVILWWNRVLSWRPTAHCSRHTSSDGSPVAAVFVWVPFLFRFWLGLMMEWSWPGETAGPDTWANCATAYATGEQRWSIAWKHIIGECIIVWLLLLIGLLRRSLLSALLCNIFRSIRPRFSTECGQLGGVLPLIWMACTLQLILILHVLVEHQVVASSSSAAAAFRATCAAAGATHALFCAAKGASLVLSRPTGCHTTSDLLRVLLLAAIPLWRHVIWNYIIQNYKPILQIFK